MKPFQLKRKENMVQFSIKHKIKCKEYQIIQLFTIETK